ncbi:NUDIX domain-containing protein [Deinococcus depolymerans]|uniref:NUDIX hydrolase n=1 Tax=Deinococcus depolymerans TaxID=392408 RepID=A0ABP3LC68_9DEIO
MTFHLVAWAVLLDDRGRVLLGRRSGTSYADGLWGLPGGHVEAGETLAGAAVREAAEEVGVSLDPAALACLGVARYDLDGTQGLDVFFEARVWVGTPRPLEKTSEVGWFAPGDLPPDALPWLGAALALHLRDGVRLAEQVDGMAQVQALRLAPTAH